MALKFLNKKGWHTGSLRNIENVWKAEQKHEAEQKKLEEFKKQIEEERERFEFRLLQEQAGLVPKQERLEFLYDSGLAVGKGSSEGFKALETPKLETEREVPKSQASVVGALFEDKPQSANDAWRKLHSDPLLMIRQREQEALARIKNNPIQMELIRKSVAEGKKEHKENHKEKRNRKEHKEKHHKKTKRKKQAWSDSKSASSSEGERREREHPVHGTRPASSLEEERDRKHPEGRPPRRPAELRRREERQHLEGRPLRPDSGHVSGNHRARTDAPTFKHVPPNKDRTDLRLSAEEKAARFREMQLDAELHEEQRWRRLKKASEADAREVNRESASSSRNFLDAAQKSVFGTEKGGSSSIEESVRRRAHYRQGRSEARDGNAFRR